MTRRPSSLLAACLVQSLLALAPGGVLAQTPSPIEEEDLPPTPAETPAHPPTSATTALPVTGDLNVQEAAAQRAYADGDLARALELYRDLIARQREPGERARLTVTAAWLSWQVKDFDGARSLLEKALYAQPGLPFQADLYTPEFQALYQDALTTALHRRQVRASQDINQAVANLRSREYPEARRLLTEALALRPNDPDGIYNLALLDLREERLDDALAGFQKVLALKRGNPTGVTPELEGQALNNSAVVYFARGDFVDAESALSEAVGLKPDDAESWYNLGLARQKLGNEPRAYAALSKAHQLAPNDFDMAHALALAEIARANWPGAVGLLNEASRARPADPDVWFQLGRAQRGQGNVGDAIVSFRKALELDPDGHRGTAASAALLLAETSRDAGDAAGCAKAASRATELTPNDAGAWLLLGLARQTLGDLAGAEQALTRASQLAPERADVAQDLGGLYIEMRDYPHAESALDHALELDPANPAVQRALASLQEHASTLDAPGEGSRHRPDLGARLSLANYAPLGIHGVRVDTVPDGSLAGRAGLRVGDLIVRLDGRPVDSAATLHHLLNAGKSEVTLAVLRAGRAIAIRIRLAGEPDRTPGDSEPRPRPR